MYKEKYPVHPDAEDFVVPHQSDIAILFVHGFTGTPFHFRRYARFFNEKGIYIRAMRLPGHGTHINDLMDTSYLDWREAVHNELKQLAKIKKKIFLLGYSFGGDLSLDAAMHYPDLLTGVILVSPPIFIKRGIILRNLARLYKFFTNIKSRPRPGAMRGSNILEGGSYSDIPVKSALEFFEYIDNFIKPNLDKVKIPALILYSDNDPLVSSSSSMFVYKKLGSEDKELINLENENRYPPGFLRLETLILEGTKV